jgi:hypothetical protein
MAGVIATGVGVTAPEVASAPVPAAPQWAGPDVGHGTESSLNWAGYGVSGGTFTKVAGSWVQPKVTCPTKPSEGAAFWVGIDGLAKSDSTVEQIGTDSDCLARSGPSYYAWYEMYPKKAVDLPPSKFPVVPGESIAAEVSTVGKTFTLTISATSGGVVKWHDIIKPAVKTVPKKSSAEWIAEAPCVGTTCKVVPLSDFGSVDFSGLSVVGTATDPKAGFTDTEITMTTANSASVKALPSPLSSGGTAFEVTWVHS